MKNKNILVVLLAIVMIQMSCKKDVTIDLPIDPVFYIRGEIGSESFDYTAGVNGFESYSNTVDAFDPNNHLYYGSEIFVSKMITAKYTGITYEYRNGIYVDINDDSIPSSNIDSVLRVGNYQIAESDQNPYGKIEITYYDENYNQYRSITNQSGNSFTILSVEDYYEWYNVDEKEESERMRKVKVQFDCNLFYYDASLADTVYISLKNVEAVLPFGNSNLY